MPRWIVSENVGKHCAIKESWNLIDSVWVSLEDTGEDRKIENWLKIRM